MYLKSGWRHLRAALPAGHGLRPGGRDAGGPDSCLSRRRDRLHDLALWGTYNLFHYTLPKLGITVKFVDADDFDGLRAAINDKTRAVYTETLGNPSWMWWILRRSPPLRMSTGCRW